MHKKGRRYYPGELIEKVCGRPFDSQPYVQYLNTKFGEIYGL